MRGLRMQSSVHCTAGSANQSGCLGGRLRAVPISNKIRSLSVATRARQAP